MQLGTHKDVLVNTEGLPALNESAMLIPAGTIIIIPVTPGISVTALALDAEATVRCMPFAPRSL